MALRHPLCAFQVAPGTFEFFTTKVCASEMGAVHSGGEQERLTVPTKPVPLAEEEELLLVILQGWLMTNHV